MKKLLAVAVLFATFTMYSQEETVPVEETLKKTEEAAKKVEEAAKAVKDAAEEVKEEAPKSPWKKVGNISLLFNQSAFNNWLAGGSNNIAGNAGLNYDLNYAKGDWTWDNKIIASYGLTKLTGQDVQKTDDRLELNSLAGKKAKGLWYYSGFLNFRTQMDATWAGSQQLSHFFSPAFFQFGPGMLWKKSDNLKVNIAPATSKLILISDDLTKNGPAFGVEQGESNRYELGAAVNGYYKFDLMDNVSVENIVNLYSNYLDDPQNVDIDYTVNVVMKINKYLSANLALQAIYDDNTLTKFQTREVFGVGVNYGL